MRHLTEKQKRIIENYVGKREYEKNNYSCDVILEQLETINDYETLWSDTDRYASDYYNGCIFR